MTIYTNFKVDDTIYFMSHNKVNHAIVKAVLVSVDNSGVSIKYSVEGASSFKQSISESEAFESKDSLLKSL